MNSVRIFLTITLDEITTLGAKCTPDALHVGTERVRGGFSRELSGASDFYNRVSNYYVRP